MKQGIILIAALTLFLSRANAKEPGSNRVAQAGNALAPTNNAAQKVTGAPRSPAAPARVDARESRPERSGAEAPGGYVPDDKYKLRLGDRMSFQVLEDRDQPKSLVVADSGELDVPYLGRVPAVDKTCKQLADEIKRLLEREYYYRASVVLALDSANRILGRVYVWGQVHNQGPIDVAVNENLTAGKAILRAGGFADFANKKKIKVIRPGAKGGAKQVFELNMVEILEDGQTEKDLPLQSDDSVIVSSRLINF
jgi:protein involved in polysaccharide export with SLBB domain